MYEVFQYFNISKRHPSLHFLSFIYIKFIHDTHDNISNIFEPDKYHVLLRSTISNRSIKQRRKEIRMCVRC